MCDCYKAGTIYQNEAIKQRLMNLNECLVHNTFQWTCTTGCLVFLPNQASIVPPALHYEMYRSVYTPPESRDDKHHFWFDWMVVN